MLNKALEGKYAVGQFNINNLEWTKAILLTAQECNSPVILGVSEGAGKYMCGYKTVVGMVKGMIEELNITVPVALHLDHGTFEGAKACINAGFSSIMFDGSHYPIAENIEKTTALVNTCDIRGRINISGVHSSGKPKNDVIGLTSCTSSSIAPDALNIPMQVIRQMSEGRIADVVLRPSAAPSTNALNISVFFIIPATVTARIISGTI